MSGFSNDHKHIDFNNILFQNKNSKQITSIACMSLVRWFNPVPLRSKNSGPLSGSDIGGGQRSGGGISVGVSVWNQRAPTNKPLFYKVTKSP